MTDIDAIRRKHERCKNFVRDSGHDENYYHAHLTVADVDALFRELDEARGKVALALFKVRECMETCYTHDRTPFMDDTLEEIEKILKGGGDGE